MITTLFALAEPNRLQIVELLRRGPLPVGEITERLGLVQPKVANCFEVKTAGKAPIRIGDPG